MINSIEQIIAQNLIDLRKSKNLKQSELSDAIGYSDKTISRWENGTTVPDITTLVKLANFYGVTLEDLIHENVVEKQEANQKGKSVSDILGNYFMTALGVLTIWVIAAVVHIGLILIQEIDFWQVYILAVPASCLAVYKNSRKSFQLRWLSFTMLSLTVIGIIVFFYLLYLSYNFWQMFTLIAPLEGIIALSTLLPKKVRVKSKKKRNKESSDKTKTA